MGLPRFIIQPAAFWKARVQLEQGYLVWRAFWNMLLEALLLIAGLEERAGNPDAAEECLEQALKKSKSMGYYQVFIDEGKELASVYARVLNVKSGSQNIAEYARKIYLKIAPSQDVLSGKISGKTKDSDHNLDIEDLSSREMQILHLMSQGLSNRNIAKKLFLSEGTVKWHSSNIYGKMCVKSRTEAVARAQSLKLL